MFYVRLTRGSHTPNFQISHSRIYLVLEPESKRTIGFSRVMHRPSATAFNGDAWNIVAHYPVKYPRTCFQCILKPIPREDKLTKIIVIVDKLRGWWFNSRWIIGQTKNFTNYEINLKKKKYLILKFFNLNLNFFYIWNLNFSF